MKLNPAFKNEFRLSSPVFRHAVRAAFAITLAIAVTHRLDLSHSVWVPLSVLVVMRPSLGGTLNISWRRLAGTAAGAAVGAFLVILNLPAAVVAGIVLLTCFFIFYFKARNYILFTVSLTLTLVVIVGTLYSHTWQGGAERIFDTLLGISIGLAASFLVWPNFARKNLRDEMGNLIQAQHRHFQQLRAAYFSDAPADFGLVANRLKALSRLESCSEKFTDASIEPGLRAPQRQELVHLVDMFTRVHQILTALAPIVTKSRGVFHGIARPEFEGMMDGIEARFSVLETYARTGADPGEVADFSLEFSRFMVFLGKIRSQGGFETFSLDSRNNSSAFIRQISRLGTELEGIHRGVKALKNPG